MGKKMMIFMFITCVFIIVLAFTVQRVSDRRGSVRALANKLCADTLKGSDKNLCLKVSRLALGKKPAQALTTAEMGAVSKSIDKKLLEIDEMKDSVLRDLEEVKKQVLEFKEAALKLNQQP